MLASAAPGLALVEALGVPRDQALGALVSCAQRRLIGRVPCLDAPTRDAFLAESTPLLGDLSVAPIAHALIEATPAPLPSYLIEALAADDGRLLLTLPVGAKRRVIEAAPERFMSELHPLILSYIQPQKHARVLADVLGTSKVAPAARRAACTPLTELIALIGTSEPSYRHLLLLLRDIYRNTRDPLVASLRCDCLTALVDKNEQQLHLPSWDPAHTLIICLDLCARRGEIDRRLLKQVLAFLTAAGLPLLPHLPALAPPAGTPPTAPKKRAPAGIAPASAAKKRPPPAAGKGSGRGGRGGTGGGGGRGGTGGGGGAAPTDETAAAGSSAAGAAREVAASGFGSGTAEAAGVAGSGAEGAAAAEARRVALADGAMVLASWPCVQAVARAALARLDWLVGQAQTADHELTLNPARQAAHAAAGLPPTPGNGAPGPAPPAVSAPGSAPPAACASAAAPPSVSAPAAVGLPVQDAELCALAQLLLLPSQSAVLLGGATLDPNRWERSVLLLLWRRLPLLSLLLADEHLHAVQLQLAGSGAPPPLPPPPAALRKAASKDACLLRLLLLHTLRCVAGGAEARAAQLLWMVGGMEAVAWDAQADFVRSLSALVLGRPALLTPALSDALLLGFFTPASSRSELVHRRLIALLDKLATTFRYMPAGGSARYIPEGEAAGAEGGGGGAGGQAEDSLLRVTLVRAREGGMRDAGGVIDREYERLKVDLPELAD